MADVFISYAHENRDVVLDLAEALRIHGWDVWWDDQISPRTQFPVEIEGEINQCSVVIVIWSRDAIDSRWVREEANLALEQNKFLPIVIDGSQPPFGFQLVDTISLEDWVGFRRFADLEPLVLKIADFAPAPRGDRPYLFGRREAFERLRGVVRDGSIGAADVVLVSGEPGVGKTSLVREFRHDIEAMGVRCLVAAGVQGASFPYQPLFEALIPAMASIKDLPTETRRLLGDFLALGSNLQDQSLEELERSNRQLFIAMTRALAEFTEHQTLALILDDFQWFDLSSVSLIAQLTALSGMESGVSKGLLLIISYRTDTLEGLSLSLVEQFGRKPSTVSVALEPLDDAASRALAEYVAGGRLTDDLVRRVLSTTRGNPLFIHAVIEEALARGLLEWRLGYFMMDPTSTFRVPKDVAHIVELRIGQRSDAAQEVLNAAAVWGRGFGIRVIADVLETGTARVIDALDELEHADLIMMDNGDYRIVHPLFQQIAYDRLSHARRQMLHDRVASYLSDLGTADPTLVASHMTRAGDLADPVALKRACRVAGERALQMYSWDDAARFTNEFIKLESKDSEADAATLGRAHHVVGGVCHRHGRPQEAAFHYETALSYWKSTGLQVEVAKVLDDLLRWHATYGDDHASRLAMIDRCEEAIADLGDASPAVTGRLLETLATVYGLSGNADRARDYSSNALGLALKHDDFELAARVSTAMALSFLNVLEPGQAAKAWEDGVQYAQRINDDVRQVRCLQRLPMPYLLLGRFDDVLTAVDQARQLNYALPRSGELSLALATAVNVHVLKGEWASVEELAGRATELIAESGYYWATPILLGASVRRDVLRNDTQSSLHRFQLVEGTPFAKTVEPMRCYVELLSEGEFTKLTRVLYDRAAGVGLDVNTMSLIGMLFESASLSGARAPDVTAFVASLEQARARGVRFALGWPYSVDRLIGVGHLLLGNYDQAKTWFNSGLDAAEQSGARVEIPIGLAYMAACERAVGDSAESDRLTAAGAEFAEALGMRGYYRNLTEMLEGDTGS